MMLILLVLVTVVAGVSTMYVGWPKDEPLPSARGEMGVMSFIALLALGALGLITLAAMF